MTPTETGQIVLDQLAGIAGPITRLRDELRARSLGRETVRLGIYQSVARFLLPGLVRAIAAEEPLIDLDLDLEEAADDGDLLRRVTTGALDLTFASLPLIPGPFAQRDLFEERYYLVVAVDSAVGRAAGHEPVALATVASLPLIDYRGLRAVHHTWTKLAEATRPPSVAFRSDDNGTIHAIVAAGLGVAVLPQLSVDSRAPGIRVLALDPQFPRRRHTVAWSSDRPPSRATLRVLERITAIAKEPLPLDLM